MTVLRALALLFARDPSKAIPKCTQVHGQPYTFYIEKQKEKITSVYIFERKKDCIRCYTLGFPDISINGFSLSSCEKNVEMWKTI